MKHLVLAVMVGVVGLEATTVAGARGPTDGAAEAALSPASGMVLAARAASGDSEAPGSPWLVDATDAAGIAFRHHNGATGRRYLPETMGSGGAVLDYDGDGWPDLYLVQSGALPGQEGPSGANALLRNRGDGTFEDVTARAHAAAGGYGQGAVAGDVDGDGWPDLYLVSFGANTLLRNRGDGTFEDVTAEAGVGDAAWGSSATLFDADADGDLDLYVVNYLDYTLATHRDCRQVQRDVTFYCHPDTYPPAADRFYRNRGDGTFEEATAAAGLTDTTGKGLGAVAGDFDGDGHPDLYVTNDSTPNFLYLNQGDGTFEEVGLLAGAAYNEEGKTEAGMGVDAGDVDGDGHLDLFVTNLSMETNALYLGDGFGGFLYATRGAGLHAPTLAVLGFGTDLLDLDNDGDLDIVVINGDVLDNIELFNDGLTWRQPGQLFAGDGHGAFHELPPALAGELATPRVGRGSLTLDYDADGRLDLAVSYNDDHARLYANRTPTRHWIAFDLQAAKGAAVGTRVSIEAANHRQLDELKTASSYQSSSQPRLHFGLGDAGAAEGVDIRWPDGKRQRLEGLRGGRVYRLVER